MTLSPPGSDLERDSYPFRFVFQKHIRGEVRFLPHIWGRVVS